MTDSTNHERFMAIAIEQARAAAAEGNVPVGSVIVRDGEVIGIGRNLVNTACDPTAHAEVVAIRDACRREGAVELPGAVCYTSMEPCPMCGWSLQAAGLSGLVLGARHTDMKGMLPRGYGDFSVERLMAMTGRSIEIVSGVLVEECLDLRRQWTPPT